MKNNLFHVTIKNSRIAFKSERHKEMFTMFLTQFNNREVMIEILEKKSKRSDQQNRYYWVYLTMLSRETGYTKDEIHEWAKSACMPTQIKEIFGDKVRIKKSTAKLTIGQFCEYIMNIEQKTGIPAPDTTEYFGYSYHKR